MSNLERSRNWSVGVSGNVDAPSPFGRVNRLRDSFNATAATIDAERACLVTDAYQKYECLTQKLKVARVLEYLLENLTIRIYPDELVVGEMGAPNRACPIYPEFSFSWIADELKNFPIRDRAYTQYDYTDETRDKLLGLEEYWETRSLDSKIIGMMSEDELKGTHLGRGVYGLSLYMHAGVGHTCPNYPELFKHGWAGLRKKVEDELSKLDPTLPDHIEKREFYQSQLIVLSAVGAFFKRWAYLAIDQAKSETGARKAELMQIAETLSWVSGNPPRTFREALQLWTLTFYIVQVEANGHSVSFGRFDQYMEQFYHDDIAQGVETKETIQELIECAFIKIAMCGKVRDKGTTYANSGRTLGGTTITVGGIDRDGKDATNDLSYMAVDAIVNTRLIDPWFLVRWHKDSPDAFKALCVEAIKVGTGRPKLFNDQVAMAALQRPGRSLEDSRDYCVVGCVEPDIPGKEYGWHDAAYFSIAKVMELAINNGQCLGCEVIAKEGCPNYSVCAGAGKRLGLATGSLADFKSFDDVQVAYEKQLKYFIDLMITGVNVMDICHQRYKPLPYLSLLNDDCIGRGIDVTAGGAIYNFSGPQAVGLGTVADGMAAIKQLVFEDKRYTGQDLLTALQRNWEGHETLYALVNSDKVHHYGNDDDYADDLARYAHDTFCEMVEGRPTAHGGFFTPGVYSVSANVAFGLPQWASLDGRKAGEPLSDCVGAVHTVLTSHDIEGPTAMLKSVAKLDHERACNGTLLNMKFAPSSVSGDVGTKNLVSLIDVYFADGGMHCQFNIIDRATLEDAVENPDEHKNLIVRVAGYSAFFNDLSDGLKNDIIGRTELSFD